MTSRTVAIAFLYGLFLLWLHYATQPHGTPPPERNDKILSPDFTQQKVAV